MRGKLSAHRFFACENWAAWCRGQTSLLPARILFLAQTIVSDLLRLPEFGLSKVLRIVVEVVDPSFVREERLKANQVGRGCIRFNLTM
jgi:hypothetical protein